MKFALNVLNLVVLFALGVFYVEGLKFVMSLSADHFGNAISTVSKIATTGAAAANSLIAIFVFNRFIFRQNFKLLGITCGLVALVYFYQIHPGGFIVSNIISSLFYFYSAMAFIFFVILPCVLGFMVNKISPMKGFNQFVTLRD